MPSTIGIVASGNSGTPFDPLSLSPAQWFDASDLTTITEGSGSVSQWSDKSGNGYHISQAVGTNQPKTGTRTINGLNVLDFDGTDDYLLRPSATPIIKNVGGATVYYVGRHDSSPTTERVAMTVTNGTNGLARISGTSGIVSGKAAFGGRTLDGDSFQRIDSSSSVSTTSAQVYIGVYDYANTDLYIYIDNVLEGTNSSFQTATATSNTDALQTSVGATRLGGLPFDGIIAEVLVYQTAHSATDRANVYGYLKSKWGL